MPRIPDWTIQYNVALPGLGRTDRIDLDPKVSALKFSTTLPGGFSAMQVTLKPGLLGHIAQSQDVHKWPWLAREQIIRPFGHVQLLMGASATLFEGRTMRIRRLSGEVREYEAQGYAFTATKDNYYNTGGTGTTSGTVLSSILALAAPLLMIGPNWADPGVAHAASEFQYKTPAQVIDQIQKEGGNLSTNPRLDASYDFVVWENRVASLLARIPPATPTYHIPFDETVDWTEEYEEVYGTTSTNYSGLLTANVTDTTFADRFGLTRSAIYQAGTGITAVGATQFNNTKLSAVSTAKIATKVTRTFARGMELYGGGERPAWLVRAGEWVQVGSEKLQPIIRTECDLFANTLTLELGAGAPPSWTNVLAGVRLAARYFANKQSPVSGGTY